MLRLFHVANSYWSVRARMLWLATPEDCQDINKFSANRKKRFCFISSSSANRKKRFYFQRKWKNGKMKNGKNALYRRPIPLNINIVSLEETFEFCWSSFADERNTLPKSTRRNVKLNIFAFGSPWLLLCKHWFMSSVWNFCRWVADVPLRETSSEANWRARRNGCFPRLYRPRHGFRRHLDK